MNVRSDRIMKETKKRVFLIVLDSLGAGEAPDAELFGDVGANTLKSLSSSQKLDIKNLLSLGISKIDGLDFLGNTQSRLPSAIAKIRERSMGKDTTIGHWEIAGIVSKEPLPTFPDGFDSELIELFEKAVGRKAICNMPYSGTAAINDFGDEHVRSGALIVYTSADSVFQIAAHEELVPPKELYEICRTARELLTGKYGVGRVIARPFVGTSGNYKRTGNRRDFSLEPPKETLCDAVKKAGLDSIAVGKIFDIFAGRGFTDWKPTHSNSEGMEAAFSLLEEEFCGLCFVNLVDFDMVYGHRRDVDGYAAALSDFDTWLGKFIDHMKEDDLLIITADHGCDPAFTKTTDHTREYIPFIAYKKDLEAQNLGVLNCFADISAEIADYLGVKFEGEGQKLGIIK